jgi:hypothetical protein
MRNVLLVTGVAFIGISVAAQSNRYVCASTRAQWRSGLKHLTKPC